MKQVYSIGFRARGQRTFRPGIRAFRQSSKRVRCSRWASPIIEGVRKWPVRTPYG